MAGAWKVAYADFVTAMMAFFLLMWILAMASTETKAALAGMFKADKQYKSVDVSQSALSNNPILQYVPTMDPDQAGIDETQKSNLVLMKALNKFMLQDAAASEQSGLTSDGVGVLLHIAPALMFHPGTIEFTAEGTKVLDQVISILHTYKSYLVVRGHTDPSETGAPNYRSKWDLASARCNAAIRYLISKGIDPKLLRSVSYADTRPVAPPGTPGAVQKNSRVEFYFHRPEVMSTVVGY